VYHSSASGRRGKHARRIYNSRYRPRRKPTSERGVRKTRPPKTTRQRASPNRKHHKVSGPFFSLSLLEPSSGINVFTKQHTHDQTSIYRSIKDIFRTPTDHETFRAPFRLEAQFRFPASCLCAARAWKIIHPSASSFALPATRVVALIQIRHCYTAPRISDSLYPLVRLLDGHSPKSCTSIIGVGLRFA